MKKLKVKFA